MNRQELQAMIDSTIVPNKKKGITAESLRLVLSEMANATPESEQTSTDLVKRIWLDEAVGFELSEEKRAENKATVEFFKNGGVACLLACAPAYGCTECVIADMCSYEPVEDALYANFILGARRYSWVTSVSGLEILADNDGSVSVYFKRSSDLIVYVPEEGKTLHGYQLEENKEIFNIIAYGDVPSPIMIKWDDTTYTSTAVRFGTINEEIGQAATIGFFRGVTNIMSVVYILSDGTVMEV